MENRSGFVLLTKKQYCENHTGPSFNTGTENTRQVSKFKHILGFEKMADFDGGESVSAHSIINLH